MTHGPLVECCIHESVQFDTSCISKNTVLCINYNTVERYMSVTHKNTVARIVICRQDGSRRFPVFGALSPNVVQTHNKNPKQS